MWIKKYVYIVEAVEPFELLGVWGVYTSQKKAEEAIKEFEENDGSRSYFITKKEVNSVNP